MHAGSARACMRCGYTGEGIGYFNKGSNIAGLVVLGLISAGFMGLFALIYYFSFHEHRVCPRCGKDWGKFGARGNLALPGAASTAMAASAPALPATGSASQGWAVVFFVLAAILVVSGIAALEAGPVVFGAGAATGGWFLHQSARKKREARRQAILTSLQLPVLQLAAQRQGRLTVTEVAAALGWPLQRAEKVLQSLDDGLRVSSDVMDGGVIVYEFRELAHTPRLSSPSAGPMLA